MDSKTLLKILHQAEERVNENIPLSGNNHVSAVNAMLITYGLLRIAEAIEKTIEKN